MQRQRLLPFMFDHLTPPTLERCTYWVLVVELRRFRNSLCIGCADWLAAIADGFDFGVVLNLGDGSDWSGRLLRAAGVKVQLWDEA